MKKEKVALSSSGKTCNTEFLKIGFNACCVTDALRFAIGDSVEANVGKWKKGQIVAQWDEGNAYRIRVDDREKTEVWAPIDVDAYVRKAKNGA